MTAYINGLPTGGAKAQESFIVGSAIFTSGTGPVKINTISIVTANAAGRWDATNSKFVSTTTGECWSFALNRFSGTNPTLSALTTMQFYINGVITQTKLVDPNFGTFFSNLPFVFTFSAGDYLEIYATNSTVNLPAFNISGIRVA